jgi:hypothetical protein
MSIVIAFVLLVAVILFLAGLSLETLRRVSGQDNLLELLDGEDQIPVPAKCAVSRTMRSPTQSARTRGRFYR